MDRRGVLRLVVAAATAAVAGCSSGGSADRRRVSMTDDFGYEPRRLTVSPGTTVEWVNDSDIGHTVTAYEDSIPSDAGYFASGRFASERGARNDVRAGLVAAGERYERTFDVEGTYEYFCVPHESSGMVGTVVVE